MVHFHPYLGKISNLTNIFQMAWNHQPVECLGVFKITWTSPKHRWLWCLDTRSPSPSRGALGEVVGGPKGMSFSWIRYFLWIVYNVIVKYQIIIYEGLKGMTFWGRLFWTIIKTPGIFPPMSVFEARGVWCFHRRGQDSYGVWLFTFHPR